MAMDRRRRLAMRLHCHRQMSVRQVDRTQAPALVGRTRFYVLMAELLNQLMVHHNVLSAIDITKNWTTINVCTFKKLVARIGKASSAHLRQLVCSKSNALFNFS